MEPLKSQTSLDLSKPWLVTHRSLRSLAPMILWTLGTAWVVEAYFADALLIGSPTGSFNLSALWIVPIVLGLEITRRYFNDLYIFHADKLTHKAGRISLKYSVPVVSFAHVRAITVSQSILGRILNYGTIYLGTAGESGNEIDIKGIVSPKKLAQHIDILRIDLERNAKLVRPKADFDARAGNLS